MTNVHHEVVRLVSNAAARLDQAERILGDVDLDEVGASLEPLRGRIRAITAEVSALGSLN